MKSLLILGLIFIFALGNQVHGQDKLEQLSYSIQTEWNGEPIKHRPTNITLFVNSDGLLTFDFDATFFNSSNPETNLVVQAHCPQRPGREIENYEIVEAFFLNDAGDYYQIEVASNGQYLSSIYSGYRKELLSHLPMYGVEPVVENPCYGPVTEDECVWTTRVTIPKEFLPKDVTKFNAFGVHGEFVDGERVTHSEALYPVGEDIKEPDFHHLEAFKEIDLASIGYLTSEESELWTQAKSEEQFITRDFNLTHSFDCLKAKSEDSIFHTERQEDHLKLNVTIKNTSSYKANIPESLQSAGTTEELFSNLHESAWVTFSNAEGQSLRVGLNPYGAYQISLLSQGEVKSNIVLEQPVECGSFEQLSWSCQLKISNDLFPKNFTRFQMVHYHSPLFNETGEREPENEIIAALCPGTLEGSEREVDWVGCLADHRFFVNQATNDVVSETWAALTTETTNTTNSETTESASPTEAPEADAN